MTAPETLSVTELEEFIRTAGARVFTYLGHICRNEDDAADHLQSALLKFVEQVRRGSVRRDTAAEYLRKIAKNEFLMTLRREKGNTNLREEEIDALVSPGTEAEDLRRRLHMILLETVDNPSIPSEVSRIITMRFLEERDIAGICAELNCSRSSAYRLLDRGLAHLADACRKAGISPEDCGL